MTTTQIKKYDVAIVGGSYAGMAAALQLARAHREVVVIDAGQPRNRFAEESHGFLSHDGSTPGHMAADAREQLLAYPTVTWRDEVVEGISGEQGDFAIRPQTGEEVTSELVILATGVSDQLPDIDGLEDRWGKAAFTCPYCDGFELEKGSIAAIATGEASFEQAMMLPEWGEVTFFLNDVIELDDVQRRAMEIKDVTIEEAPIRRISGEATIEFGDDQSLDFSGIALATDVSISDLPETLGCELGDGTHGPYVRVDDKQATSVDGVFACGDIANPLHNISFAVADGVLAGTAAHSMLLRTT